jgi:hypothetical protein
MRARDYVTFDRVVMAATGLTGLIIGVLDFLELIPENNAPPLTKLVLAGIGALMIAAVAESVQRERGMQRLDAKLDAKLKGWLPLSMQADVPQAFERGARAAHHDIHEAVLSWVVTDNQQIRDSYRNQRDRRVSDGSVFLRQVVVIHHAQHFEEILGMVIRFKDNAHYDLRCYEPGIPPLPAVSLWSFDGSDVYIGSFEVGRGSGGGQIVRILDSHLTNWLDEYWRALFVGGTIVKQGLHIHWDVLDETARRLGIDDVQYSSMKSAAQAGAKRGRWINAQLRTSSAQKQ